MMEQASQALVRREYFVAQKLASEALRRAHGLHDYDRMVRILLPLQESRRQIRDLAFDSGNVAVVSGELPSGRGMQPGCYLVAPPRVGVDGRALRETAERRQTPTIIVVREPTTRDGLWPVVAVGPVTVRAKVAAPAVLEVPPPASAKGEKKPRDRRLSGGRKITRQRGTAVGVSDLPTPMPTLTPGESAVPSPEWFLAANEALGDAAIGQVESRLSATARVEAFFERLEAMPDHERLHQALEAAARVAAREVGSAGELAKKARKPVVPIDGDNGELDVESRDEERRPPEEDF